MLADNYEAIAVRCLQNVDNSPVYDVGQRGAVLGGFSVSQIDTCKRHDCVLWLGLSCVGSESSKPDHVFWTVLRLATRAGFVEARRSVFDSVCWRHERS